MNRIKDYKKEIEISYKLFDESEDKKKKTYYYRRTVYCFKRIEENKIMTFSEYLLSNNLKSSIRDKNRKRFMKLLDSYVENGSVNTYRNLRYCFQKCDFESNKKLIYYIKKRRTELKGDKINDN